MVFRSIVEEADGDLHNQDHGYLALLVAFLEGADGLRQPIGEDAHQSQ